MFVGLLLYVQTKWNDDTLRQDDVQRHRFAGPERTMDDRQQYTIKLFVSYRPARQISITWGIGEDGDHESRMKKDRPEWEVTRTGLKTGILVNLGVDNFDEGGYLNCEIIQNGKTVRHFNESNTDHWGSCDLYFVVGGK